jgi:GNAT superfamily N-acetyltransferase
MIELKELHTVDEMLAEIDIIRGLYADMTEEQYRGMLEKMIPMNYKQLAAYSEGKCIALSGFWIGTKLWCGTYLELDNVVVAEEFRSQGVGKLLSDYLENKAKEINSTILVLDAYVNNYGAHRFYYNQGYVPKGFHFVKILNKDGING